MLKKMCTDPNLLTLILLFLSITEHRIRKCQHLPVPYDFIFLFD